VPFLYGGVVTEHHWLNEKQFVDAVAVAMITPGPVVITVGFIGYLVAGLHGACVAALGTFLPCYLFTILPAPYFKKYGKLPAILAFVDGVTAAAVGAITGAVIVLAKRSIVDVPTALLAVATVLLLVKFKKLAGGGYFQIINRAVPDALRSLGYSEAQIAEMEVYAVGHGSIAQAPAINHATLAAKGFTPEKIDAVEKGMKSAFDIKFVFNKWTLGEDFCKGALGIPAEKLADPTFDLLRHLGFTKAQIDAERAKADINKSLHVPGDRRLI
jgi:chromate transport protein ChrA